jgi:hypothetical protein
MNENFKMYGMGTDEPPPNSAKSPSVVKAEMIPLLGAERLKIGVLP